MRPAWALAALLTIPCAAACQEDAAEASPDLLVPGGLVVFYHDQGPLSFVTMTLKDLPKDAIPLGEVQGYSCQYALSIPTTISFRATNVSGAAGNGGYRKTLESMRSANPNLIGIYDVRIDDHTLSILGVFRRSCVEVTARGFKRPSA